MKVCKKLSSILLAVLMVVAMAIPAFAAQTGTITIPNATAGKEYKVYKVFDAAGDGTNISYKLTGNHTTVPTGFTKDGAGNVTYTGAGKNGQLTAAEISAIAEYVKNDTPACDPVTATETTVTFTNLPNGYYYITTTTGTAVTITSTNPSATVYDKNDVPTADKKIVEGDNRVDTNEASIGDTVKYEITGTLPTNFDAYNEYYYVFTDTLSKGLTYNNDAKVVVRNAGSNDVDVTKYFYKGSTGGNGSDTTIKVGIQDLKQLNNLNGVTVNKDSKIIVTYSATLNENAEIGKDPNTNEVFLEYYNNPNDSSGGDTTPPDTPTPIHPTGETPDNKVETYTTELTVLKTDGENNRLTGAEFTLSGDGVNIVIVTKEVYTAVAEGDEDGKYWKLADGTYTTTAPTIADDETDNSADYDSTTTKYKKTLDTTVETSSQKTHKVTAEVDAQGQVTFTGLGAGRYTLEESKTPDGYNTIAPIKFKISFKSETTTFETDSDVITVGTDNTLSTTVVNLKGNELPETGGMGTTLFYIVGGILVIGAGVLLVTKRRVDK